MGVAPGLVPGRHRKWDTSHFFCLCRGIGRADDSPASRERKRPEDSGRLRSRLASCVRGPQMNGADLIRAVDFVHREKNIPKEVIFASIEKAVRLAIHKCYEEDEDLVAVNIDRQSGNIVAQKGERTLEPEELGRIAAQSAKQMIIQNFREEESNSV